MALDLIAWVGRHGDGVLIAAIVLTGIYFVARVIVIVGETIEELNRTHRSGSPPDRLSKRTKSVTPR